MEDLGVQQFEEFWGKFVSYFCAHVLTLVYLWSYFFLFGLHYYLCTSNLHLRLTFICACRPLSKQIVMSCMSL